MSTLKDIWNAAKISELEYSQTTKHAELLREAAAGGCTIIFPKKDELLLDLDTEEQFGALPEKVDMLGQMWRAEAVITRAVPSNSGLPHRHVTVQVPGCVFNDATRAGLQMFLGSDPVREALCFKRIDEGVDNPTVFVEGGNWKK